MQDYKPNSNRYKEEQRNRNNEKKVDKPIVTSKVITKKPSKVRKFTNEFISEDARNVKSFVLGEVLIPSIKKAISDIVTNGIDIILYGEARGGKKHSRADQVSYRDYYDRDRRPSRFDRPLTNSAFSYDDIVLATRGEAQSVLERMDEIIDKYKMVCVGDLYDLVGITPPPTSYDYGWLDIHSAEVIRVKEGYWIKLPKAVPID